ncbi:MAG: class I adenylate-forming enzyme family protein [Usitatibacter sp.]
MLIDRFLQSVERAPDSPAFFFNDKPITYLQARAILARAVVHLRQQGVKRGDLVGLALPQHPLYPILFMALGWIGAMMVPLAPNLRKSDRNEMIRKFDIRALIAMTLEVVPAGCRLIQIEGIGARGTENMDEAGERGFDADTPLRLAVTTGTTGLPKGVVQTHAAFEERMDRMHCDLVDVPRILPPGMHITISINLAMHALCKGGAVVIPRNYSNTGLFDAIRMFGVTHVTLPPANLALLLVDLPGTTPAFPGVKHLRLVGSTPTRQVLELARTKFSPHVYVPYGLGEVGLVSMALPEMVISEPGSCGVLEPGVRLELSEEGEIRVHIPGQPTDYHGPDAGLKTRFRDGWFYPGDRGHMSPEGMLYIEGRIDHIINVGGLKVSPEYSESVLIEFEGVREAAVFAVTDASGSTRMAAAIVPSGPLNWAALKDFALKRLQLTAPIRYLEVPSLPRNPMGKLERHLISEDALPEAKSRV